jgi:hypothetical protein
VVNTERIREYHKRGEKLLLDLSHPNEKHPYNNTLTSNGIPKGNLKTIPVGRAFQKGIEAYLDGYPSL